MKKILLLSVLCLFALQINAQEYVDLGLPSGTKWKSVNEMGGYEGFYTYEEALAEFRDQLPTKEQLEELKDACTWSWTGSGYKVTGPNGQSITLPAAGIRSCNGNVYYVGAGGGYWSSKPLDSVIAWCLRFDSSEVYMYGRYRCYGLSVRLVQD